MRRAKADDVGSASLWMLALSMVVWVVAGSVLMIGAAIGARHSAAGAADLAALAGAEAADGIPVVPTGQFADVARLSNARPAGPSDDRQALGCAAARATAAANGTSLDFCTLRGDVIEVTVSMRLRWPAYVGSPAVGVESAGLRSVDASARAGPA